MLDSIPLILAQDDAENLRPTPGDGAPGADGQAVEGQAIEGQDGAAQPQQQNQSAPGGGGGLLGILPLLLIVVLFLFLIFGPQRKEKKRRQQMMAALSKGDRIQTVGGILGTVVEVRDDEIVVKVDENTNSRLRFAKSAVQSILKNREE